jgi:hypothetical protein
MFHLYLKIQLLIIFFSPISNYYLYKLRIRCKILAFQFFIVKNMVKFWLNLKHNISYVWVILINIFRKYYNSSFSVALTIRSISFALSLSISYRSSRASIFSTLACACKTISFFKSSFIEDGNVLSIISGT